MSWSAWPPPPRPTALASDEIAACSPARRLEPRVPRCDRTSDDGPARGGGRGRPRLRRAVRRPSRARRPPTRIEANALGPRRDRDARDRALRPIRSSQSCSSWRRSGRWRSCRRSSEASAPNGSSASSWPRGGCWSPAPTSSCSGARPGRRPACGCCACASSPRTRSRAFTRPIARAFGRSRARDCAALRRLHPGAVQPSGGGGSTTSSPVRSS